MPKANSATQQATSNDVASPKKAGKSNNPDGEKKPSGVSFEVYQSEASTFQNVGEYRKAISSYTKALEMKPNDKKSLISRAQCYLRLGISDKALADSNETLLKDKHYTKGLLLKAEAYYQMMQFEYALMYFHRGNKLRPEMQQFRLGIQKSQEAIDNCIGENAGIRLENKGDLSFFYEEQELQDERELSLLPQATVAPTITSSPKRGIVSSSLASSRQPSGRNQSAPAITNTSMSVIIESSSSPTQKQKKQVVSYSKPSGKSNEKTRDERQRRSAYRDSKTCKQLLGELFADKEYLENLLKETEAASNQSDTNKAIRNLAIQGLDYLDTRTEFWQQQKPMYSRKRDKELLENARKGTDAQKPKDPARWILKNLEDIDEAQADGRYEESLKQAQKVLKEANRLTDMELRNRQELLANIHSCIGNAHLELGDYPKALDHHNRDYEIAKKNYISDAKSRALDNLGRVYARMGKFDKAIETWKEKLPMTKSPLENTWLFHEIGRCYLEMGNYDEAKSYGRRSLEAAQEADDDLWQLNSSVLLAQANVKLGDVDAAMESFEISLKMAQRQQDEAAETAVRKAIANISSVTPTNVREEMKSDDDGDEDDDRRSQQSPENDNHYGDREKEPE